MVVNVCSVSLIYDVSRAGGVFSAIAVSVGDSCERC